IASATILPPSSTAENPASPPWNFPMGVRTAESTTGVSMCVVNLRKSYAHHYTALRTGPLRTRNAETESRKPRRETRNASPEKQERRTTVRLSLHYSQLARGFNLRLLPNPACLRRRWGRIDPERAHQPTGNKR